MSSALFWLPVGLLALAVILLAVNAWLTVRLRKADRRHADALLLQYDDLSRLLSLYNGRLEHLSHREPAVVRENSKPERVLVSPESDFVIPRASDNTKISTSALLEAYRAVERSQKAAPEPKIESWNDVKAINEAKRASQEKDVVE